MHPADPFLRRIRFSGIASAVRGVGGPGLMLLLLSGCALIFGPRADRTRFYTLTASEPAAPAAARSGPRLLLRGVEIPDYLRGKAIAVRRQDNEIDYIDSAWWSETLDQGIARVLREDLSRLGLPTGSRRDQDHDLELTVRVERADGRLGEGQGSVEFSATFELRQDDGSGRVVGRGRFAAPAAAWKEGNYDQLAEALSGAVAALAGAVRDATPAGEG